MEDDPIVYGEEDVKIYDGSATDVFEKEDDRPFKRPRLSPEIDPHEHQLQQLSKITMDVDIPVAGTEETTISVDRSSHSLGSNGNAVIIDTNAIPGLFLVSSPPIANASQKDSFSERLDFPDVTDVDNSTSIDDLNKASTSNLSLIETHQSATSLDGTTTTDLDISATGYCDDDMALTVFRDEDEFKQQGMANRHNEEAEWQLDSSAEESLDGKDDTSSSSSGSDLSDSEEDSSSDDGNTSNDQVGENAGEAEDEEEEDAVFLDIQQEARRLMDEDEDDDDDTIRNTQKSFGEPLRTKNELPEPVVSNLQPSIEISPSTPIVALGSVESVVDFLVLVKATVSAEYQVLNENSVLCFEDRSVLGHVQETFGRVEQPFYTVRIREAEDAKLLGVYPGRKVLYVPSHSTFLFTKSIKAAKGSDASNLHDEEIGEEEREFSDDEAEAEYKKMKKEEKKGRRQSHQVGTTELSDEPYTPLSRPANLHHMLAGGLHPVPLPGNIAHNLGDRQVAGAQKQKDVSRGRDSHGQNSRGMGRGRGRGARGNHNPRSNGRGVKHQHGRFPETSYTSPAAQPYLQPTDISHATHETNQQQNTFASGNAGIDYNYNQLFNHNSDLHVTARTSQDGSLSTGTDLPNRHQTTQQFSPYTMPPIPRLPTGAHINPAFFGVLPPQNHLVQSNDSIGSIGQQFPNPLALAYQQLGYTPSVEDILRALQASNSRQL